MQHSTGLGVDSTISTSAGSRNESSSPILGVDKGQAILKGFQGGLSSQPRM